MKTTLKCFLGAAAVLLATAGTVHADHFPLSQTFDDPTPTRRDNFGTSVAIDGGFVLIGAPGHDIFASAEVGQALLFEPDEFVADKWNLLQTFNDPSVKKGDEFGFSVAMDGGNVLIGARRDDTKGTDVGQALLFNAANGNLLQTFNDPTITTTGGDEFGYSVAINGNYVLIGAPFDDTNGTDVGQAHLFDAATGTLLRTFDDPTVTTEDRFGWSVAFDGGNVLIGAPFDDTSATNVGQAHLFDAATGNLLQTFNDPTVTVGADQFGASVAIDGGNVLIGAPFHISDGNNFGQAHLFDAATANLLQTFDDPTVTTFDIFGFSVALDGGNVLIGAPFDETNGALVGQAHLFDAVTGLLLETFNDPTVANSLADFFGSSVAIDGGNVLIGAPGDNSTVKGDVGQAHLFVVPEPSGFVLMALGMGVAALFASSRRRREEAG